MLVGKTTGQKDSTQKKDCYFEGSFASSMRQSSTYTARCMDSPVGSRDKKREKMMRRNRKFWRQELLLQRALHNRIPDKERKLSKMTDNHVPEGHGGCDIEIEAGVIFPR